ncbi:MAG: hypothetical protein ABF322_10435 [Lentimonas sp.]
MKDTYADGQLIHSRGSNAASGVHDLENTVGCQQSLDSLLITCAVTGLTDGR